MKRFLVFALFAVATTAHAKYPNRPVTLLGPAGLPCEAKISAD